VNLAACCKVIASTATARHGIVSSELIKVVVGKEKEGGRREGDLRSQCLGGAERLSFIHTL
jgi:hypothetical protein